MLKGDLGRDAGYAGAGGKLTELAQLVTGPKPNLTLLERLCALEPGMGEARWLLDLYGEVAVVDAWGEAVVPPLVTGGALEQPLGLQRKLKAVAAALKAAKPREA